MRHVIVAVVVAFTSACGAARAPIATTFEELPARVIVGQTVAVDDDSGARHRGPLVRISPDGLVLREKGAEFSYPSAGVRRVATCCDPLANGAAIGAVAGLVLGLVGSVQTANNFVTPSEGRVAAGLLLLAAIGAGIGVGIDAAVRPDTVVFQAPGVTARVAGAPGRPQMAVTVAW
jgi:hypothetical protein